MPDTPPPGRTPWAAAIGTPTAAQEEAALRFADCPFLDSLDGPDPVGRGGWVGFDAVAGWYGLADPAGRWAELTAHWPEEVRVGPAGREVRAEAVCLWLVALPSAVFPPALRPDHYAYRRLNADLFGRMAAELARRAGGV